MLLILSGCLIGLFIGIVFATRNETGPNHMNGIAYTIFSLWGIIFGALISTIVHTFYNGISLVPITSILFIGITLKKLFG